MFHSSEQFSFAKHALFYFFGVVLVNASNFILIPIYTRYLHPSDYGILEFIYITVEIAAIIFSAGIGIACISLYSKETDIDKKKEIISTGIISICVLALFGCSGIQISAGCINSFFFNNRDYEEYIRLGGILLIGQLLLSVPLAYIQAEIRSKLYITVTVLQSNITLCLNIFVIAILEAGIKGVLWNTVLCSLLFSGALIAYTIKNTGLKYNWIIFRHILHFGLPFIPGGLFLFILNSADRFFIQKILDASTLGIYSVGYKLGTVVAMFVLGPFLRIWTPLMFELDKENKKHLFGKYFIYLVAVYCILALLLSIFAKEIMFVFTGSEYWRGYEVVPIVALAFLFWATAAFYDSGFYITEKTYYKPIIMGIAAGFVFALYWLLIPKYGMLGGAWATAISFFLFSIITYQCSKRIYLIHYPIKKYILILIGGIVIYSLCQNIQEELEYIRWMMKFILWIIYVLFLLKIDIIENDDKQLIRKYVLNMLKREKNYLRV